MLYDITSSREDMSNLCTTIIPVIIFNAIMKAIKKMNVILPVDLHIFSFSLSALVIGVFMAISILVLSFCRPKQFRIRFMHFN